MIVTKDVFYDTLKKMDTYIPFEQSEGWCEFKSSDKSSIVYFVDNIDNPMLAYFGRVYNKPFVGRIVDIIGEVWKPGISKRQVTKFFKGVIQDAKASMICYNSVSLYDVNKEIGLRCVGFVRPLGNRVCPLTQLIGVQEPRNFDSDWRRNLKKAEKNALTFDVVENPSEKDAVCFVCLFDELRQRKQLGFSLDKNKVTSLLLQPGFKICYARLGEQVLCARIIYICKKQAADVFAANSFNSMRYSATHFIMESIFNWLKKEGVEQFDFSRISPSANETNTIYQFKDAAGGCPAQYLGEWIWTRNSLVKLLFCVYNFLTQRHSY